MTLHPTFIQIALATLLSFMGALLLLVIKKIWDNFKDIRAVLTKLNDKQYKVEKGGTLTVEKLPGAVGDEISFDNVLMFSDGENVKIGRPAVESATVRGHIVEQGKAKKIIVFKYKRRKRYRKTQGHRQQYTAVKIDSIEA